VGWPKLHTHFRSIIKSSWSVDLKPPQGKPAKFQGSSQQPQSITEAVKAKLFVSFILDADTLCGVAYVDRNSIARLRRPPVVTLRRPLFGSALVALAKLTDGKRVISIEKIRNGVLQRMLKSPPDDNHARFLDSASKPPWSRGVETVKLYFLLTVL